MKNLFRAIIFLAIGFQLLACGQSVTENVTASPIPPPSVTSTPTITPSPSETTTATIEPTPRPSYASPTPIPTIDLELLKNAFSIQSFDLNGYNARRITGWEHGFGGGRWAGYCDGFYWLDANHLLLYPTTGQLGPREGYEIPVDAAWQPVVVNLESGMFWLPPVNTSSRSVCEFVFWSRDLGVLINSGIYKETPAVFTHTFDGKNLARYRGQFTDISPSREKILLDNNLLIDLRTNSRTTLAWSLEDYQEQILSDLFWTSDETRIYRCCYFYADLANEISYRIDRSDFQDQHGNHLRPRGLPFYRGQWVQNDTYFLVEWSWGEDGDIGYLPMLDLVNKISYEVREMAGISVDWHCYQTKVSPDGTHVWMAGWGENGLGSYLVNLATFETQYYHGKEYLNINWSSNGGYAWVYDSDPANEANPYSILSVSDKAVRPLPVAFLPESSHWWHPTDNIVVYPSKGKNALIFLEAQTMSYRELPFKDQNSQYKISNLAWSPNGDKLTFITDDHILWQMDYPSLENLEQVMASANTISSAEWSPDGNSIAFVNGSDIYIVDIAK